MTGYDPQRNRTRAQPSTDGPAPVDLLLSGEAPAPQTAHAHGEHGEHHDHEHQEHHDHEHGPDCDHDHEGDLRVLFAAAGVSAATVVFGLRRWRRRKRSAQ